MIKITDLTFGYDEEHHIFEHVDLTFSKGKTTIVLGKNGTGKTTLFHLMADILKPLFGHIDKSIDSVFIPDEPRLYAYLTGYEYLEYVKILSKHALDDKIVDLITLLDMRENMSKMIYEMSLGMKHKIALMSALLLNYEGYIIDEPLTALDPPSQKLMINFFKRLKDEGKTLIISTHIMHIAYELADELIILNKDKVFMVINNFDDYQTFETSILPYFDTYEVEHI